MTDSNVPEDKGNSQTPVSLLRRVQAEDQAAWDRLVSLYGPLVYRWCRLQGLQAADAADVGQEVFRAVSRKIRDFRREKQGDTFRGWLRTITRNKIRDYFRAIRHRKVRSWEGDAKGRVDVETPDSEYSEPTPDHTEAQYIYQRAMELLRTEFEERTWQAFWLIMVEGKAPSTAAETLGMSINAVYVAKSRVLRRLRDEFEDLLDNDLF